MTIVIEETTAKLIQVDRNKVDLDIIEKGQARKRILDHILSDTPVVGVYNGAYLEYNELWKLIKSKGGNPYLYEPLDSSNLLSLPTELASVLPIAKHAGLQSTKPWKIQYRVSTQKTVSRRTLLLKPMVAIREYTANPVLVDYKACASAKRCSLCIDSCPEKALAGKPPTVDPLKCTGCGMCTGICPFNAIVMPGWGVGKVEGVLGLIREKYNGPLVMIIVERASLPELSSLKEIHSATPYVIEVVDDFEWVDARTLVHTLSYGVNIILYDRFEKVKSGDVLRIADTASSIEGLVKLLGEPREPVGIEPRNYALALDKLNADKIETSTPVLGIVEVNDECTLCDSCVSNCPTRALRKEVREDKILLLFNHEKCVGCKICEEVCPHNAIRVKWGVDKAIYGKAIPLVQDEVVRCRMCGKPLGSKSMFKEIEEKMRAKGIPEIAINAISLCDECKTRMFRPK